jgi:hypothetical protein
MTAARVTSPPVAVITAGLEARRATGPMAVEVTAAPDALTSELSEPVEPIDQAPADDRFASLSGKYTATAAWLWSPNVRSNPMTEADGPASEPVSAGQLSASLGREVEPNRDRVQSSPSPIRRVA